MTARGKSWGGESRKALPWQEDEYLYIEGKRYLYLYFSPHDISVLLPGRGEIPLSVLRAQGLRIVDPVVWRKSDFAER